MERDFEPVMIEQCAPVLAGLEPAGLFRYETRNRADLARRVAGWNAQLNPKGLQVRVLRGCIATRQYLVYVYRAAKLQTVLADAAVRGFLAREGYRLPEDAADCNALLAHSDPALAERYARILPMLEDMAALSRVLEGRRRRRGALALDTRESKELTAVLRELMNLQQTLEGQQPGGSPLRVVLEEETEDWSV